MAAEIGFARRQSPARARKMLGLAQALTNEMVHTLAALADGTTSEYRAQLVAAEFGCLSPADRMIADEEIGPKLAGLGDARSRHAAAGIAGRLDPEAVLAKIRGAIADRRVSIRPAPDTMLRLSAVLPLASGMAAFCALRRAADLCRATADDRTQDQFMADELVARLINAAASPHGGVADPAGSCPSTNLNSETGSVAEPTDPSAGVADPVTSDDSPANSSPVSTTIAAQPGGQTGCDDYGATHSPGGAIDLQLINPPAGAANGCSTTTTNPSMSPGTGRSPPPWPDTSSVAPKLPRCSCGGCSPIRTPGSWSRWTPAPGTSPRGPAGS